MHGTLKTNHGLGQMQTQINQPPHGCKNTCKVRYSTTHHTSKHPEKPDSREEGLGQEGRSVPEDLYLHRVLVASVLAAVNQMQSSKKKKNLQAGKFSRVAMQHLFSRHRRVFTCTIMNILRPTDDYFCSSVDFL